MFFDTYAVRVLSLCALALSLSSFYIYLYTPAFTPVAKAAANNTINFQARLLTNTGALVPDGYYNAEFKLYNVSSGGSALWTDTRYDTNGVTAGNDYRIQVKNGYLTVSLGDTTAGGTAFPGTIDWSQELWLSMNIGGTTQTATPTWNGEMSPRMKVTAVPYAFAAKEAQQLKVTNGANTTTISVTAPTSNRTITFNDASGTVVLDTVLTTEGDIYYRNSSGLARLARGSNGDCLKSTSTTISWGSCGAASGTLQAAYDAGNTITTTNARDILFTLANTATDSNFLVNIASGSGSKFAVQNNGTDVLGITTAGAALTGTLSVSGAATLNGNVSLGDASTDAITVNGYLQTAATADAIIIKQSGGGGYKKFIIQDSSAVEKFSIKDTGDTVGQGTLSIAGNSNFDGNVTLGNASTDATTVNGYLQAATATDAIIIKQGAASGYKKFIVQDQSGVEKFSVKDTGETSIQGALTTVGSATFQGTVTINGGTNNGVYYRNSSGNVVSTTAGSTGQCLVATTGSAPSWGSCGAATTLQGAYDAGNTITTTDARNIAFTLANTATDANFSINIATSSTGKFSVQNSGVDIFKVDTTNGVVTAGEFTAENTVNLNTGNVNTNQSSINLLNTTAATVNAFGDATTLTLGATTGTTTVRNAVNIGGNLVFTSGINKTITTNNTSALQIFGGDGTGSGYGGGLNIYGGNGGLTGGDGGGIAIIGGAAQGGSADGGVVTISGGTAMTTGTGGLLSLNGGWGYTGAANGGAIQIMGGQGGSGGNTNGGNVEIIGGTKTGTGTSGSVIVRPYNSSNNKIDFFSIQNGNSVNILNIDTTNGELEVGSYNGGTNPVNGKLVINNSTNANTVTIVSGTTSSSYTLTLPTALGASGDCLKDTTGAGVLGFGSCGTAVTLQDAYDAGASGDQVILLDATQDSVIFRNPASSGSDSTFTLKVEQLNTGSSADALVVTNSGTGNILNLQDAGTTVLKVTDGGYLVGNATATGTTGTTSGTGGIAVTTITLAAAGSFANNDIIFVDNTGGSGQDYYTRIVSGGGTTTLTVSPAVSYGTTAGYTGNATITKYTAQNIGATGSDYTTQSNRFFQGYFLGGVVTGAGSTTLSDGNITSSNGLKLQASSGVIIDNPTDISAAFKVQNTSGGSVFSVGTSDNQINLGASAINAIDDPMASTPTGTMSGPSYCYSHVLGQYLEIVKTSFCNGQITYFDNSTTNYDTSYQFNRTDATDNLFWFSHATTTPVNPGDASGGYKVSVDNMNYGNQTGEITLYFNSTLLATSSPMSFTNNTWHDMRIVLNGTNIKVYYDGSIVINYTDTTRSLTGNRFGLAGKNGGYWGSTAKVRNLSMSTTSGGVVGSVGLNVYGTAKVQSVTNSATAFQIQNGAGLNLLTADTINKKIQVGSSTTDTVANLFVVDSYDILTDPTGVNGAQYYNTKLKKFRCYQDNAWVDCDQGHTIQDEGTDVTKRSFLNFTGSGVSVTDVPSDTNEYPDDVNASSPLAYWRFESGALTTDSSGNSKTLTSNGTPTETSPVIGYGGAVDMGNGDYYSRSDTSLINLTTYTVEAWFKPTGPSSGGIGQILGTSYSGGRIPYTFRQNGSTIELAYYDGSTWRIVYQFTQTVGASYYLALVNDNGEYSAYVNGTLAATYSGTTGTNSQSDVLIGKRWDNTEYAVGVIDEAAIFNTVLSGATISARYDLRQSNGTTTVTINGSTLQQAYNISTGGTTPEIKLDATRGGLDVQDADTTIAGNLLTVRASNGAGLGAALFSVNSTGQSVFKNSTNSTSAFSVQNASGTSILTVDTLNERVGINSTTPTAPLSVGISSASSTFTTGFESGSLAPFTQSGGQNINGWAIDSVGANAHSGTYSARASINQTNPLPVELSLTKTLTSAGNVTFWMNKSYYTCITFYIDGVGQQTWNSGGNAWAQYSFAVGSGTHTLKWSATCGDAGTAIWLDDITLTNTAASNQVAALEGGVAINSSYTKPNFVLDINTGSSASTLWAGVASSSSVELQGGLLLHQNLTYGFQQATRNTGSSSNGQLVFDYRNLSDGSVSKANIMTLQANGNIGIGTASPSNLLHVGLPSGGDYVNGFESGSLTPFTQTAGSNTWVVDGNTVHSGGSSAHAYSADGNATTKLEITKTLTTSGTVSFWMWKNYWTGMSFEIDGVVVDHWNSGANYWNYTSHNISAGTHTFSWYGTGGDPTTSFFIDDVTITNVVGSTVSASFDGSVGIGTTSPTARLQVSGSNTTAALQVQNNNGVSVLNIDTTNGELEVGSYNGGTNPVNGKLVINNSTNANTVTLVSGATSSSYTLTLPTALGASGDCLKDTTGAGVLGFVSCGGSGTTLQGAYDGDTDGSDSIITLTSADDSVIFRNPASSGTDSNFTLKVEQLNTGSGVDALVVSNSGTSNILNLQNAGTKVLSVDSNGNLLGNGAATGTTGTTEATARTNVTTVELTAAGSFANNDIIFINNAGQDYYTRIVSGGGTTTLTVSPAVSYDASATVTKYTVQNIGASTSDYTTQSNRFFQGYFLGGVVTGAGSTTLSDGNITSSNGLKLQTASGVQIKNSVDSETALLVQNVAGNDILTVSTIDRTVAFGGTAVASESDVISDSMTTTPSGSLMSSAIYVSGQYVELNSTSGSSGAIEYTPTMGDDFDATFQFYTSGNADAVYMYAYNTSTPTVEDQATGGYMVSFSEYNNRIRLTFNGSVLATYSQSGLNSATWRDARFVKTSNNLKVYLDSSLVIDYNDISRTLTGDKIGLGSRSGGSSGTHRVKNFVVSTIVPTTDPVATINTNTGQTTFKNSVDSTSALQIQNAAGTSLFVANTIDRSIGINTLSPIGSLQVTAIAGQYSFGFETGGISPLTDSGSDWSISNTVSNNGTFSATAIAYNGWNDYTTSALTLTKTLTANGTISFARKMANGYSCGAGCATGGVIFKIDGVVQETATNASFAYATFNVSSGAHTFTWEVSKTGFGYDSIGGWVDDITITNTDSDAITAVFDGGNIGINTTAPTASLDVRGTALFRNSTNSTSAFSVQNGNSVNILNIDTTNGELEVGSYNGGTNPVNGKLVINNSTNANTVTIVSGATSSSYTLTLPTALGASGDCLKDTTGAGVLGFVSCGGGGGGLAKDAMDTSSASVTAAGYLYGFTNSNSAVASGVLSLDNGTNTGNALRVTTSGNPTTGLIFASNTNASPSGNLLDLQSGSSPTSKFSVTAAGAVTAAGLVQGNLGLTITGGAVSLNAGSGFNTSINTGTSAGNVTIGSSNVGSSVTVTGGANATGITLAVTSGTNAAVGNIGGSMTLTTGNGGNGTSTSGGNAGSFSVTAGNGGSANNGNGGLAGTITLTAGNGGPTSVGATGRSGGAITLTAGNGGNGVTNAGNGGSILLKAGNKGTTGGAEVDGDVNIQNRNFNVKDIAGTNTLLSVATGGARGLVSVALGNTASTAALCTSLANATAPTANVLYELRDCSAAPAADYAEMYPVTPGVTYGDIVSVGTTMVDTYGEINGGVDWNTVIGQVTQLVKSTQQYQQNVIGIVSNNYGDFTSAGHNIKAQDNPMPVALNGRVPVKISSSSAVINPGDYITTSASEAGKGEKAMAAGMVIGKALEAWSPASGKTMVMVYVEQGYYPGPSTSQTLQGTGLNVTGNAMITGNLSIGTNLNVSGTTTLDTLTVNGDAVFTGNLTVQNITVANITVNGKIITAGNTPTVAPGIAAGVADPLNNIAAPTVTITGNDTSGTITIVAGANTTAGDVAEITFDVPFTGAPRAILSAKNANSASLQIFNTTQLNKLFLTTISAPTPGQSYQFDYIIVQ